MQTKIIEGTQSIKGERIANWGKFLVGRLTDEWEHQSIIAPGPLLAQIGFNSQQIWVMDLQTCEGAAFLPGGSPTYDLKNHKIWVCPMFEPFLMWLYEQDLTDLAALPNVVELPDAEFAISGYRRPGPKS